MKTIKTLASATLAVAAIAFTASAADAQINANVGAGVNANTNLNVGTSASGSVKTSASGGVSAGATSSRGSSGAGASTSATSGVTATGAIGAGSDEGLVVTRGDVVSTATAMSAISVSTQADLKAYATSFISSDEDVTRVEADADEVSVWYKQPAKLLGFIPVRVSAQASVNADGTVDVDYPWYSFLTTYDDAKLESDLDVAAGSIARAESTTDFSASVQARIIEAIHRVVKAHAEASAQTDAEVEVQ